MFGALATYSILLFILLKSVHADDMTFLKKVDA